MSDLISRQLVIETLCERRCGNKPKGCPAGFCTESLAVDCIPSAERKKGEWFAFDDDNWLYDTYRCSNCRKTITVDSERRDDIGFTIEDMNYCPYCGADMRGEDDE